MSVVAFLFSGAGPVRNCSLGHGMPFHFTQENMVGSKRNAGDVEGNGPGRHCWPRSRDWLDDAARRAMSGRRGVTLGVISRHQMRSAWLLNVATAQGLTLVHLSAQRKRFLSGKGAFRGCLGDVLRGCRRRSG